MNTAALALSLLALATFACSTPSVGAAREPDIAPIGPASWQGPLADRMNQLGKGPVTPALKGLTGRQPLVYLVRSLTRGAIEEPGYELAVFDDGTVVYEGHRCVKVGGVVLTRLGTDALDRVQRLLAERCVDFGGTNAGELCDDIVTLRVLCASGPSVHLGGDRCRRNEPSGRRLEGLRAALVDELALAPWLGEPTQRQACAAHAPDLAPHELARAVAIGASSVTPP